MTTVLTCFYSW